MVNIRSVILKLLLSLQNVAANAGLRWSGPPSWWRQCGYKYVRQVLLQIVLQVVLQVGRSAVPSSGGGSARGRRSCYRLFSRRGFAVGRGFAVVMALQSSCLRGL